MVTCCIVDEGLLEVFLVVVCVVTGCVVVEGLLEVLSVVVCVVSGCVVVEGPSEDDSVAAEEVFIIFKPDLLMNKKK